MSHPMTRRRALTGAAGAAAAATLLGRAAPARAQAPVLSRGRTKIVVLGSQGGQQITQITGSAVRCGTSVLIDVDGELTVLDCGCGSAHRISEAGYDLNQVRNVVITHFHADHVVDLGSVVALAWSSGRNGADPNRRIDVYGPTGLLPYAAGLRKSLALSILDQEGPLGQRPVFAKFAHWHEQLPPRKAKRVFADDRLEVQAIRVHHGSMPAVGYRIRTPDVDVAFSGDRGATGDDFPTFARGADALFHEVLDRDIVLPALEAAKLAPTFIAHLVNDHCDPTVVGQVATTAQVPLLVLYHLIPGNPGIGDDVWAGKVAPTYAGQVVVAHDLLVV
jgi:ribonuclease BN (tRNA processing enzyme)